MARTGGELIVDALVRAGVRHAFGIAGVHNLPIYDAIHDQDTLVSFATRHEQGAAYMADGYARASGRPGVALVTTGPGLTNTVTPLAGAWSDSVPLLVIGLSSRVQGSIRRHGRRRRHPPRHARRRLGAHDAGGVGADANRTPAPNGPRSPH